MSLRTLTLISGAVLLLVFALAGYRARRRQAADHRNDVVVRRRSA